MKEINAIRLENFEYMQGVINSWMCGEFDSQKMVEEFESFGKEKYGEMVFKSTVMGIASKTQQISYH